MKRLLLCLVCLLCLGSGQVVWAEPAVVIGSFSSLENATALQNTAADQRLIVPVWEVRIVQTRRDGQLLHRVVYCRSNLGTLGDYSRQPSAMAMPVPG